MEKYCTIFGCKEKLTWHIEDGGKKLTGLCPIHGNVTGILRDRPLTIIGKNVLIVRGYRISYQTLKEK